LTSENPAPDKRWIQDTQTTHIYFSHLSFKRGFLQLNHIYGLVFSETFLVKQYVVVNVKPLCPQFGTYITNQHTHDDPVTGYNIMPYRCPCLRNGFCILSSETRGQTNHSRGHKEPKSQDFYPIFFVKWEILATETNVMHPQHLHACVAGKILI